MATDGPVNEAVVQHLEDEVARLEQLNEVQKRALDRPINVTALPPTQDWSTQSREQAILTSLQGIHGMLGAINIALNVIAQRLPAPPQDAP